MQQIAVRAAAPGTAAAPRVPASRRAAAEIVIVGVLLTLLGPAARRWTANLLLAAGALLSALRLSGHPP